MPTIRAIGATGWERGREIRLRALQDCPDAFSARLEQELEFSEEDWRRRLRRSDAVTFIAIEEKGCDVGLIVGAPYGEHAGIFSMWVAPEARRQGIGGQLVDAIISWARQNKERRILLDVGDWNISAISLYQSKGFHPTGIVSAFPSPREHITEHQRELIL